MAKPKSSPQTDPELAALGNRIRTLRKKAGFTAFEHFAYDHGFSRAQVGKYEHGQNLTYKTLCRLAAAFNITVSELLDGLGPKPEDTAK